MTSFTQEKAIAFPPHDPSDPKARELRQAFEQLKRFEDRFCHDLALFDYASQKCDEGKGPELKRSQPFSWSDYFNYKQESETYLREVNLLLGWRHIAARDATFAVYEFIESTKTINSLISAIPGFRDVQVQERLGTVHAIQDRYFSDAHGIRNAAGHIAEFSRSKQRAEYAFNGAHDEAGLRISEGAKNTTVSDSIFDRKYTATYKGRLISCEISQENLDRIKEVRHLWLGIFG